MNINGIFISGIHSLEVDGDLKEGLVLFPHEKNNEIPGITLTNNKEKICSLLTKQLPYYVGAIEFNHIKDNYPILAFSESKFNITQTDPLDHLDRHLFLLKMYFFSLWLIKDNSCDLDIGFLQYSNQKGEFVSSNTMTSNNFDCLGERKATTFTIEEIMRAADFLKTNIQIEYKNRPKFINASPFDKVSIAHYFIQNARSVSDLGLKTLGYCSALEVLFSNGENTELTHRLAERISKFLENNLDKRIEIYKSIKKIYELRSKVAHGASIKENKTTELIPLITCADNICRRIMQYGYVTPEEGNIFSKSKEDLDKYFLELVLI